MILFLVGLHVMISIQSIEKITVVTVGIEIFDFVLHWVGDSISVWFGFFDKQYI